MKLLYLFLISFSIAIIKPAQSVNPVNKPVADSTLIKLKAKKAAIDSYLDKHPKAITVLVKVPGKKNLVRVINEKWPDEVEYTYNIVRDTVGKVILIAQTPTSQSGDWFITYTHYFDDDGKVFAFRKQTNVFDGDIKDGVIYETLTKYYGVDFKNIGRTYTLQDKQGKAIKDNGHIGAYQYKYAIYKKVKDCLAGYGINRIK